MKMYFKCKNCQIKGEIGGQLNPEKEFFIEGWHVDKNNTKHQIIVCNSCGTMHDVFPSLLKFPLVAFLRLKINPYIVNGYFLLSDIANDFEKNKDNLNAREIAHYGYNLNDKVIQHMINKGFFDEDAQKQINVTYDEFLKKFKK